MNEILESTEINLEQQEKAEKNLFGFWVYLMTDLLTFAALFAAFAVLRNNTFGGPSGKELFKLPFVLTETFILLTSSFTSGLTTLGIQKKSKSQTLGWFALTFGLGVAFLTMELTEFHRMVLDGNGPSRSGFLSGYFALVGTHGLHILVGLLWMLIVLAITVKRGLTPEVKNNLNRLAMFWHFLDIVWIFIFTIVYLMGVI